MGNKLNKFLPKKQYYLLGGEAPHIYEPRLNFIHGYIIIDKETNNAICEILNKAEVEIKKILQEAKDIRLSDWDMIESGRRYMPDTIFYYPFFDKYLIYIDFNGANHNHLEETINDLNITKPKPMKYFYEIKNEKELEEVKEELEKKLKLKGE